MITCSLILVLSLLNIGYISMFNEFREYLFKILLEQFVKNKSLDVRIFDIFRKSF